MDDKVLSIIKEYLNDNIEVNKFSTLEEIDMDPVVFSRIIVKLEQTFNIEFDDEKLPETNYKLVQDVIDYVKLKVG